MRITYQSDGGFAYFPGLNEPVEIDTEALAPAEAETLKRLVAAAALSSKPAQIGVAAPGAADYRTHTITVHDGDDVRTVTVIEPIADPAVAALVDHLHTRQRQRT